MGKGSGDEGENGPDDGNNTGCQGEHEIKNKNKNKNNCDSPQYM
jgi:hypothetical protein